MAAIISKIIIDSIAEEVGLKAGDVLLYINEKAPIDFIEYRFLTTDETVYLKVSRDGEDFEIEIEKDEDEDLGIIFTDDTFDKQKHCANNCIFCFEDQMPSSMRESLRAKDDDYRLSFLHGNFITLTNIKQNDFDRIYRDHLSPLYISIHATNDDVRRFLLGNKNAPPIISQLREFVNNGIELHTQIVLCPEINDGIIFSQTLKDLHNIGVNSIGTVPVGLTDYRNGKYPLRLFTKEECKKVIDIFNDFTDQSKKRHAEFECYLADEFYLKSGVPLPEYKSYGHFSQYENGIGMTREFLEDTKDIHGDLSGFTFITGKLFEPVLKNVIKKVKGNVLGIENLFYGKNITVTGLLTGSDILKSLQNINDSGTIIVPSVIFNADGLTLDDMTIDDMSQQLGKEIISVHNIKELL